MELVLELFVTAFVALVFSFVVAKLVSIVMAGGADERRSASGLTSSEIAGTEKFLEEVKFGGGLRVQSTETERRVRFVDEAVEKLDEFAGERSCCGEEFGEKMRDSAGEEVSDATGWQEKLPEVEAELNLIGGDEVGGTEEEMSEGTQGDVFTGVEDKIVVADLIVEEKIVENVIVVGESVSSDVVVAPQGEEVRDLESGKKQAIGIEEGLSQGDEKKEGLVDADDEDDWEGIEKSELEELFAGAANFAAHRDTDDQLSNIGSDVQMQLYGLHKVATEGPCHEPQPMALKVSARAKCDGGHWLRCARNAWQRLGSMSPEVAMEQYITLLSDKVPGWMGGKSSGDGTAESANPLEPQISGASYPTMSTYPDNQLNSSKGRKMELKFGTDGGDRIARSNSVNKE